MRLRKPTIWAIAAWMFFLGVCRPLLMGEDGFAAVGVVCLGLCAAMALITGVAEARKRPEARPVWAYLLAALLGAVVLLFLLPVPT